MKNVIIAGLLFGVAHGLLAPSAEAHGRHRQRRGDHHHHTETRVIVTPWGINWAPVRPRPIRINEHCVYKPWKDVTVCRYRS